MSIFSEISDVFEGIGKSVKSALPGLIAAAPIPGGPIVGGVVKRVVAGSAAKALTKKAASGALTTIPSRVTVNTLPGVGGVAGRISAGGRLRGLGGIATAIGGGAIGSALVDGGGNGGGGGGGATVSYNANGQVVCIRKRGRRMNYMNYKAAKRAVRRIKGVRKICHDIERQLPHKTVRARSPAKCR